MPWYGHDHGQASDRGLRTIDELNVEDQRVLLRADFDVRLTPLASGSPARVTDDTRIRAALQTIEELRRRGARLVLVAHLDHPRGPDPGVSMRPVAERLAVLTGAPVRLAPAVVGSRVRALTGELAPGAMLMLENVRFEAGEVRNDPSLAAALAELAELYVNDAFACAHRTYASTVGVARLLPAAAGRLMEREVPALSAIVESPAGPLVAILGGAKVREKIDVVHRLLGLANVVCVGGAACFPFLAARGHPVGQSLCRPEDLDAARQALSAAGSTRIELPSDLVVAGWDETSHGATVRVLDRVDVPPDCLGLDIGPRTAARYAAEIASAATVFWDGPMGRYELTAFAGGTRRIAEALASSSATTVAGGGDTELALRRWGLRDRISHVSAGGQATLEFLAGRELPGVRALLGNAVPAT